MQFNISINACIHEIIARFNYFLLYYYIYSR